MEQTIQGTLEEVKVGKQVNTQWGLKDTFVVKVGGLLYSGFGSPPQLPIGSMVVVRYQQNGQYKNVVKNGVSLVGTEQIAGSSPVSVQQAQPVQSTQPPPSDSRQKSIIRQNALRHATMTLNTLAKVNGLSTIFAQPNSANSDDLFNATIGLAKKFEEFINGLN